MKSKFKLRVIKLGQKYRNSREEQFLCDFRLKETIHLILLKEELPLMIRPFV